MENEGLNEDIKQLLGIMNDLISRSEARVDRTNEIIGKAYIIIDKITSEYTSQITKLQISRDKLIEENEQLIKIVEKLTHQLEANGKKYDSLLDKIFSLISINKGNSENNINIK